jgi:chorismate synthase
LKGKLLFRELDGPDEYAQTEEVSRAAWRFSDRQVSPAGDLIAATHAGGLTAGAFEGKRMLGFVHGIPRVDLPEKAQHSHLLAVLPEAQGRGLSTSLKLFQRRWCLDRGVALVTWTYDPFLLKNARLNLGKLRATVHTLLPNFYGVMGGIYASLPTDRFEITWRLADPEVERAAVGAPPLFPLDGPEVPIATSREIPGAARVALPFPPGAPKTYKIDPGRSLREKRAFRRLATELFEKGYEAYAVAVREAFPVYLLRRRHGA